MSSVTRRIEREVGRRYPVVVQNPEGLIAYSGTVRGWNRITARMERDPAYKSRIQARIAAGQRVG